jgi:excisionase family DNA binding protein
MRQNSQKHEIEKVSNAYEKIKHKEYLSVAETAFLLSLGRATIYRYLHNGTLIAFQTSGKTFIRKADIDKMFDETQQYKARPHRERKLPVTELYTLSEIKEKYKVKEAWIYKIVRENNILKILSKGKRYYSKKHIDNFFAKKVVIKTKHVEKTWTK